MILSCDDPISIEEFQGYQLAAPASFWNASDELRNSLTGGCGPGGIGDYFVPDTMYGLNMMPACIIHDWCFAVWDDKPGFVLANNIFKNNMIRINEQHKDWLWLKRLRLRIIKSITWLSISLESLPILLLKQHQEC